MKCDPIVIGGKFVGIMCSGGRRPAPAKRFVCQTCFKRTHTRLCDYADPASGKTCDKKLCDGCAVRIAKDVDFCPGHPMPMGGPSK